MQNTIGYVSTERTQTSEEMNTEVDLSSSVELLFKTDYVSLDRLAGAPAQERIRVNALNPDAEAALASTDRQARRTAQASADAARSSQVSERLVRPAQGGAIPATAPTVTAPAGTGTAPVVAAPSGGGTAQAPVVAAPVVAAPVSGGAEQAPLMPPPPGPTARR